MAFVQPERKKNNYPICHACGKYHEGGIDNCHQISDTVQANIKKLVKAGVFDGNGGNTAKTRTTRKPTQRKQDTANAVIEEEDNGEQIEVKEDKFPPCEYLLQMLGMSNTFY